ncbi:nuclear transport factor 2 family protein [Alteromonas sp. ASW11-19]|uniref:Nuclear transport factor 2 family protein n=1 Tax=Alteromonas salexigens TaxID=2982530 RepID=A0ABT2VM97_9ALTE|nr:nuclear transport factor 2 family protein [Alteromonas salexigens]MCU7553588.1 nuclear transport factor 2 family protein [Alteromonas salexigens]
MRTGLILSACFLAVPVVADTNKQRIHAVLNDLHTFAADANGKSYFSLYSPNSMFIGTDASETWSKEEFQAYAQPYFSQGQGWTYTMTERTVTVAESGQVAWFVEMLHNDSLGVTRGTGVLQKSEGEWRVEQYHLTLPVPNAIIGEVAASVRAHAN